MATPRPRRSVPAGPRRAYRRLLSTLIVGTTALAHLASRAHTRMTARDDTGLSSPEKAALTVLGLALAGIVASAAVAYVNDKVALFQ